jgi:hypothetical protein
MIFTATTATGLAVACYYGTTPTMLNLVHLAGKGFGTIPMIRRVCLLIKAHQSWARPTDRGIEL